AKHMNALLIPTEGKMLVNKMDTSDMNNLWNIRETAGMVFQNPDNQLVATIVEEDVAFGPENLGVPPEEIRKRVDEALERVGMS
ncbi:ABC transporter ATP-binding protein, partial [Bifidobacterium longum]|nr:ABC transporter ATP-binding protein [Bifidobacterium longum]